MISVAELISDPDFAQSFTVLRSNGSFQRGGFVDTKSIYTFYGIIELSGELDLQLLPEGDRTFGAITIHSTDAIFLANNVGDFGEQSFGKSGFGSLNNNESDIVMWRNQQWKCTKQFKWIDFGYYKTIAVRMSAE